MKHDGHHFPVVQWLIMISRNEIIRVGFLHHCGQAQMSSRSGMLSSVAKCETKAQNTVSLKPRKIVQLKLVGPYLITDKVAQRFGERVYTLWKHLGKWTLWSWKHVFEEDLYAYIHWDTYDTDIPFIRPERDYQLQLYIFPEVHKWNSWNCTIWFNSDFWRYQRRHWAWLPFFTKCKESLVSAAYDVVLLVQGRL